MTVMFAVSHSLVRVIWRDINVYILGNAHMSVMCAVNHSVTRVIWRHMNGHIVGSGHLTVMCVVNHLVIKVSWRHIYTDIWVNFHTPEMCAIGHLLIGAFWMSASINVLCVCVIRDSIIRVNKIYQGVYRGDDHNCVQLQHCRTSLALSSVRLYFYIRTCHHVMYARSKTGTISQTCVHTE